MPTVVKLLFFGLTRVTSPSGAMAPIGGYACVRVAQRRPLAAMARRDRSADPVESLAKVADLKASSDIAGRGLTCRTLVGKEVVEKVSAAARGV